MWCCSVVINVVLQIDFLEYKTQKGGLRSEGVGLRTNKGGLLVVTEDRVLGQKDEVGKGLGGQMWRGCAQVTGGYE